MSHEDIEAIAKSIGLSEEDRMRQLVAQRAMSYPLAEIDARPADLPDRWKLLRRMDDGAAYQRDDGLTVIASASKELDGKRWLHVSCSRQKRMPSYEDLATVKKVFVGPDRAAIQVFAKASEHVNLHKFCLHLWCCLDGDPWPDFTHGGLL